MAIQCKEKQGSPVVTNALYPEVEAYFVVTGTTNEYDAKLAVTQASSTHYDLYGDGSVLLPRAEIRVTPESYTVWSGVVRFVKSNAPIYQFDLSGGTQNLKQSLRTLRSYSNNWAFRTGYIPATGEVPKPHGANCVMLAPPNHRGAIGWDGDTVNGVDIVVPVYNWSETFYIAGNLITGAYKAKLFALTGKVNDAPFRGFEAGEVLFLGARGSRRGIEDWEIYFGFSASQNKSDIYIGRVNDQPTDGEIGPINKRGWEYLWIDYQKSEDASAKAIIPKPKAVYVEQVYEEGAFSDLGIGVT